MNNQEARASINEYKRNWGIVSVFGLLSMWLSSLGPHECSPVVGCVVESIMFVAIIISILLIVIRLFKKNKLKLITPLILIVFFTPSTFFYLSNTI